MVCGLPAELAEAARTAGFGLTPAGDEAIIDPRRVEPRGRQWRDVRAALKVAPAPGLRFRCMTPEERASDAMRPSLRPGSAASGELPSPSEGPARRPRRPRRRREEPTAASPSFVTWVPARDGWMLDALPPRRMAGLADYLTASSLHAFRDEGCPYASLSGRAERHLTPTVLDQRRPRRPPPRRLSTASAASSKNSTPPGPPSTWTTPGFGLPRGALSQPPLSLT